MLLFNLLGSASLELFIRYLLILYGLALIPFVIGVHAFKQGVIVLLLNPLKLDARARFGFALRRAWDVVLGIIFTVLWCVVVYHRREIFLWVKSLF